LHFGLSHSTTLLHFDLSFPKGICVFSLEIGRNDEREKMKTRLTAAVLVFVVGLFASATAQSWRIGDDQPFPIHISDLPAARQNAILLALEPSLQELGLEPDELDASKKTLLVRHISTDMGILTVVQGWGLDLCGGTGNCKVWVLGKSNRLLLAGQAYRLTILRTTNKGLPSIVTSSSWTGQGSDFIRYSFDGSRYRPQSCAFEQMTDYRGKVYAKPRLDYVDCKLLTVADPIQ